VRVPNTRRTIYAHRLMYFLTHGEIDQDALICHRCDNRCCVNPDHLYSGDYFSNIRDSIDRGHFISGFAVHRAKQK